MRKIIIASLFLTTLILATSCGDNKTNKLERNIEYGSSNKDNNESSSLIEAFKEDETKEDETKVKETQENDLKYDLKELSNVSIINKVLKNELQCILAETGEQLYLKNLTTDNYIYLDENNKYVYTKDLYVKKHKFTEYINVDLDEDGCEELLLQLDTSNILILRFEKEVYAYILPYRGLMNIKEDKSFTNSGGAMTNSIGKIKFSKEEVEYNEICLIDLLDSVFTINGKLVDKEVAEEYFELQEKKENLVWKSYN